MIMENMSYFIAYNLYKFQKGLAVSIFFVDEKCTCVRANFFAILKKLF